MRQTLLPGLPVINSIFLYGFPESEPPPLILPLCPFLERGSRNSGTVLLLLIRFRQGVNGDRGLTLSLNPFTGIWIFHRRANSFNPFSSPPSTILALRLHLHIYGNVFSLPKNKKNRRDRGGQDSRNGPVSLFPVHPR